MNWVGAMTDAPTKLMPNLIHRIALGTSLVCVPVMMAFSPGPPTKEDREMLGILNNQKLTAAQKVEQLSRYVGKVERWITIFGLQEQCDKLAARDFALRLFRKPDTSTDHKLECGWFLLTRCSDPITDFIAEYAPFLIDAILKQGSDEFVKVHSGCRYSAVGQYAFTAAGYEGYKSEWFDKLKDKRVIPVLIRCLDAPDYAPNLLGGNYERKFIPIALARLQAVEAAAKLKHILEEHHDSVLRFFSAYALGFLLPRSESVKIEQLIHGLKDKDAKFFLFSFGSGLVERGETAGMQYLAFKYSPYYDDKDFGAVLYMLEERVEVLRKSKVQDATALTAFYQGALTYAPLRAVLEFDAPKLEDRPDLADKATPEKRLAQIETALMRNKDRILTCYKAILADLKRHGITALSGLIAEIAEHTRCKEIQALSRE